MDTIVTILIAYLLTSIYIAVVRIYRYLKYERDTYGVPRGELESYEEPTLFDGYTKVFYPARLIIIGWAKITRRINRIR